VMVSSARLLAADAVNERIVAMAVRERIIMRRD